MTNLTEQWKQGKLPSGEYYVKDELGLTDTYKYYEGLGFSDGFPQEVLAEVPSYDEWKSITDKYIMFIEANQRLRREIEEEKAKNRIDYYIGSPMDYLDECERARRKNKIYQNWIKNINKELLTSELRKTKEGNLFIVNLLKKIDQVLQENK